MLDYLILKTEGKLKALKLYIFIYVKHFCDNVYSQIFNIINKSFTNFNRY